MGYYSQVAIAMSKDDYNTLVEKVTKLKNENDTKDKKDFYIQSIYDIVTNPDRFRVTQTKNYTIESKTLDVVILTFDYIKWYETDNDISYIMNFVRSLGMYQFIRIGEEYDDIEVEAEDNFGSFDPVIETQTTIRYLN